MNVRTTGVALSVFRFRKAGESPASQLVQELRQRLAESGSASPDPFLSALQSLASEKNSEIFFNSLLSLGRRAAAEDPSRAGTYFQFLSSLESGPWRVPPEVRREAQAEAATLRGEGSFGRGVERMGKRLFQDTNFGTVAGMGVAATLFSGFKLVGLSQLVSRPASFLTRGWAVRALASAAAFPAEVGGFWLTDRLYRQAVHPENLSWSWRVIFQELGSLTSTLGLMKLGAAGGGLFGMYAGIVGGHWLERRRSGASQDGLWSDSLLTLAQFYVGGKVSEGLLGPGHAALMREMALRTRDVSSGSERSQGWRPLGDLLNGGPLATVSAERSAVSPLSLAPEPARNRGIFLMEGEGDGHSGITAPPAASSSGEPTRFFIQFAEDPTWNLTPPLEAVLESLQTNGELSPEQRADCATELYRHYPRVREILEHRLATEVSKIPEKERRRHVELVLQEIKRCHFESISDELHDWFERFRFLQSQLRLLVDVGTRKERVATRRGLDSVSLKLLETRRYHFSAESYLGDSKEPSPTDPFSDERYPALVQRFTGILQRLCEYREKRPKLAAILESYPGRLVTRYERQVSSRMFAAAMAPLSLEVELQEILCAFQTEDPFLQHFDIRAIYRLMRHITQDPPAPPYIQAPEPLREYLQACLALQSKGVKLTTMTTSLRKLAKLFDESELRLETGFTAASKELSSGPDDPVKEEVEAYLHVAEALGRQLHPYCLELRNWMMVDWSDIAEQWVRLGRRGVLNMGTVNGLLHWFDPPVASSRNQLLLAAREDAVAGLIDFIGKGTHSPETRAEIAAFLREAVRRGDEKMLEILAVYFQNYQLGVMRDRIQVRERPRDALTDQMAVEAYDRFLEAMQSTARFYLKSSRVRGLFLDVFDKLSGSKRSHHYQLAVPIWHRCRALLHAGYEINLFSRGGMGEAVLTATSSVWGDRMIAITSCLGALGNRGDLEDQLDRAWHELENNRNGREYPRYIYIHLPHIRSGVAKAGVLQWVADYLHDHSSLAGIDVYLPRAGNEVADIALRGSYRRVAVTRENSESTSNKMDRLERKIEEETGELGRRLELYQLRKSWIESRTYRLEARSQRHLLELAAYRHLSAEIEELEARNLQLLRETGRLYPRENFIRDEIRKVLVGWSRSLANRDLNYLTGRKPLLGMEQPVGDTSEARQRAFADFLELAMGVRLEPERVQSLIDLACIHAEISDLAWKYEKGEIALSGDVYRMAEEADESSGSDATPPPIVAGPGDPPELFAEADNGHFSFKIARVAEKARVPSPNPRESTLEIHLDKLVLPRKMDSEVRRNIFGELIRLGEDLGAQRIHSLDIRDGYEFAAYGVQFASPHERMKLFHYFRDFLDHHIRIPGLESYDLSALSTMETPQHFAHAFLDPETKKLSLEPPATVAAWEKHRRLPYHYLVGQLYLRTVAPSWNGVFDLSSDSKSRAIFDSHYERALLESVPPSRSDTN